MAWSNTEEAGELTERLQRALEHGHIHGVRMCCGRAGLFVEAKEHVQGWKEAIDYAIGASHPEKEDAVREKFACLLEVLEEYYL